MRFPALDETDLLVPLHEGQFEQPLWQTFLARLRAAGSVGGAAILLHGAETVELVSGSFPSGLLGEIATANPALRDGRVYDRSELDGVDTDVAGLRVMRLHPRGDIGATLALIDERPIGAATGSLLASLAPHFRAALRTFAALERERTRAELSEGVIARMNFGWISLDRQCRIVDLNAPADRVLRLSGLLRRGAYDRLVPASPAADRELGQLVARCAEEPDMRPHALNLSRDPWIDLLVTPVRVEGLGTGGQAVALVYLRGDRSSQADRQEQLADLFQLTPSEAKLAWSMAQGLSIAEAAEEHGLTTETARYYSKKIYAKTGARGQADLVRHILTGVLALA
ncbi:helix-turn-helix transcriptional regulator [Croceicoccus bisphenolivorans]|uniref:helix-turn-helix transcriptional regulator n=1 Tax=Croceicoccus bisphenolivorans TaxID=1783232 RepID=UPI000831C1B2|nr:hypothetical protein [Croceicoccus bisphenolivorans]